jgi:hypothetical protein
MYGKRISEGGKSVSEGDMSTIALDEAKEWHDDLMDVMYKGRGDKEKAVRGRLSDATGIPESYLFRLQYKFREMTDVAGSAYRALMLLHDELCTRNEAAAQRMRAERLELRNAHEANQEPAEQAVGMDSPED